jgi:hypothetical protein
MIREIIMKRHFKQFWWATLVLATLILLGLSGCSESTDEPSVQPAADRPTFVWIFSDP